MRMAVHVFDAEETVRDGKSQVRWLEHTESIAQSTQTALAGRHENMILLEENIHRIVDILGLSSQGCRPPRQVALL